jgi:phosphoenolpyruvate-protein kinase (PTS system EI component)
MGAQVRFLPLLAGIGLNKISAAAPVIANLKAEQSSLSTRPPAKISDLSYF